MMMGLVLAAMVGVIDATPVLGRDDQRIARNDRGRDAPRERVYHRDNRGREYYRDRNGKRFYRSYGYRRQVYVPPPVVYAPPPPPGISIFFPPLFFHPWGD